MKNQALNTEQGFNLLIGSMEIIILYLSTLYSGTSLYFKLIYMQAKKRGTALMLHICK